MFSECYDNESEYMKNNPKPEEYENYFKLSKELISYFEIKNSEFKYIEIEWKAKTFKVNVLEIKTTGKPTYDFPLFMFHGITATLNTNLWLCKYLQDKFKYIVVIDCPGSGGSDVDFNPGCNSLPEVKEFIYSWIQQIFTFYSADSMYIFAHSLGGLYLTNFFIWNLSSKKYNIKKIFFSSPFGYTSYNRWLKDEKALGKGGIGMSMTGLKNRLMFSMLPLRNWLLKGENYRKGYGEEWQNKLILQKDRYVTDRIRQIYEFNLKYQPKMDDYIQYIAHPANFDYSVEGFEELLADKEYDPKSLVLIFGDQDWMDTRGAKTLEQAGKLVIIIMKDGSHSPQLDQPEQFAKYMFEHLK